MGKFRSPWSGTTTALIVIFLLMFAWFLSSEKVKAETKAELNAYATLVGGQRYDSESLLVSEMLEDRHYSIGLLLQPRLDCVDLTDCKRGESKQANQAFFISRNVYHGNWYMSLGFSYWNSHTPAWNSHTPYLLGVGYEITDNLSINYKHFSTGGSSSNNGGLDLFTVGWNF